MSSDYEPIGGSPLAEIGIALGCVILSAAIISVIALAAIHIEHGGKPARDTWYWILDFFDALRGK